MFLLRLIGTLFLLIATLSLIEDGTKTLAYGRGIIVTPLAQYASYLRPGWDKRAAAARSKASKRGADQANDSNALKTALRVVVGAWDSVVTLIIPYPGWLIFGGIGTGLCYAGRTRKRTNIFAN